VANHVGREPPHSDDQSQDLEPAHGVMEPDHRGDAREGHPDSVQHSGEYGGRQEQHAGAAEDAQLERDRRPHHHVRVRGLATVRKPRRLAPHRREALGDGEPRGGEGERAERHGRLLLQHHVEGAPAEDPGEDELREREYEAVERRPEHVQDKAERVLARRDAGGPVRPGVQRDDHHARRDHHDGVERGHVQRVLGDGAAEERRERERRRRDERRRGRREVRVRPRVHKVVGGAEEAEERVPEAQRQRQRRRRRLAEGVERQQEQRGQGPAGDGRPRQNPLALPAVGVVEPREQARRRERGEHGAAAQEQE